MMTFSHWTSELRGRLGIMFSFFFIAADFDRYEGVDLNPIG